MIHKVRGKFFVIGFRKDRDPGSAPTIELAAVSADDKEKSENTMFHDATPWAEIKMSITNKEASDFFAIGDEIYVDFVKVPKPA